ncbi:MAG TPA: D-alanyl-D-alanine carboxypeptidase/D-alanyl-D-alanine-endopeptidase [Gaiellaceae bacterium]|nr:D-alanyl-D-alanine carboxypeptidase/D-alanyl-D-alanine-endopeptidase [Gaiellaceae bacterium]
MVRRPRVPPALVVAVLSACVVAAWAASASPAAPRSEPTCKPERYLVRSGDTLTSIALRFQTTVDALARANSMDPNGILYAGASLVIPRAACGVTFTAKPAVAGGAERQLVTSLRQAIAVPGVSRARTGVVVVDLDANRVMYAANRELSLEPASTAKLPVAMTALQRLGGAFRIRTAVLGQGSLLGGIWRGDLVLKGYGDPMLTTADLNALARAVRARGITAVSGAVVGDESYFDELRTCPGWKPSFARNESPLLSALVVNRGLLDGAVAESPALAAAVLFTRALQQAGVTVAGRPMQGVAARGAVLVARRASRPLTKLLARMDTWSDNFIAEMLLKQLGARVSGRGSTAAGAATVGETMWADGVPLTGVLIADGSGLSTLNRLTARSLAAMLQTVWHEPKLRPLLDTFAVAGSTGTLRRRLLSVPGHELVRGKTGTTDQSSALAGFVGSRFAFAILNNGSPVNWSAAHTLQDRVVTALLAAV